MQFHLVARDILEPHKGVTACLAVALRNRVHQHHEVIIVVNGIELTAKLYSSCDYTVHWLWIDLHLTDKYLVGLATKLHLSCDTVPIALCLVGHAVGVLPDTDILYAVINAYGNDVTLSWNNELRDVVLMGCGERRPLSCKLPVDIDTGLDMRTFQIECHDIPRPVLRYIDAPFIPRHSHEVAFGRKEEGELQVVLLPILFHPGVEIV